MSEMSFQLKGAICSGKGCRYKAEYAYCKFGFIDVKFKLLCKDCLDNIQSLQKN